MTKKRFSRTALRLVAGVSVLAFHSAMAWAQEIETVIVTVDRHAENEQDVPISTATVSGDDLTEIYQSGEDIKALANHVPSVYAESSNGRVAPRFYIRGLGNTDFDLAASQPVSILMDDVVQENTVLKSAPIFDIDNVEVDRGPQGTLFGRNTTAGVIKFTTHKPSDDTNGYLSASTGELGTSNVEGAVGGAITDTLSYRASGLWQYRDNYINNAFTGQDGALGGYQDRAARVQLLWQPDDDFSALLNVHGRSLSGTAAIFRANIIGPGNNHLNSNYSWDNVYFDGGANNPQAYNGYGSSLVMDYKLPGMKLTSISGYEQAHGYSRGDIDGGNLNGPGIIFFPSESQDGLDYLNQYSEELHLASDDDSPLFWQVGAYYFDTSYLDRTVTGFAPYTATGVHQSNTSFAAFGQASYKVTPDLTFTGGVRWTSDVKALTAKGITHTGNELLTPITVPVRLSGDNISWDGSADYAVSDNVNLYARVASGFRAPSIQGRNLAFNGGYSTARSETVLSYEAGVKTELFDKTLRLNADGYYYYVHNMQLSAIGGGSNSVNLINAHGGLAYGLESDAEWLPTENLQFTFGASWTHTEIRSPGLKTAVCAQCTIQNPEDGAGNAFINGNPFPQAPDFILSTSAKYTYPLPGGDSLFAYTDWWLQGYTNFFLYKSAEFKTNGNYEGDLKVGYTFPGGKYDVYAYAQNITDKQNLQGGIDFDDNTGFVGDPRVIGVGFDVHF